MSRVWEALKLVQKFKVPVTSLIAWTSANPDFATAQNARQSIKANFEPEQWRLFAKPVFDELRKLQRDALVTYEINKTDNVNTLEQLYEYLLLDPGMEPVNRTSRIRLAISSVQLFTQRCLMKLEPDVSPKDIVRDQWEWMKRYRVWEANRKVFMFPENWLEPEFRDNKSHLFTALEGELLQDDITPDRAEDAFYKYINGLEEIARLDIVSTYQEYVSRDSSILHVLGRTYNEPGKYFYRKQEDGMWTPWVPVDTDIDSRKNHVVITIWRGRVYLFWLKIIENRKAEAKSNSTIEHSGVLNFQLNWCEYYKKEWKANEGSGVSVAIQKVIDESVNELTYVSRKERLCSFTPYVTEEADGAININIGDSKKEAFRLAGRNAVPDIVDGDQFTTSPYCYELLYTVYGSHSAIDSSIYIDLPNNNHTLLSPCPPSEIIPISNLSDNGVLNGKYKAPFFAKEIVASHTLFAVPKLTEIVYLIGDGPGPGMNFGITRSANFNANLSLGAGQGAV
jgi:hypothetical protein